jgi:hypothetical protein
MPKVRRGVVELESLPLEGLHFFEEVAFVA